MDIINLVNNKASADFKEWIWEKFEEWRKGSTNGPSAYARYLGVKQQLVSGWLNGDYKPRMESIIKLAEKYPDVYEVLGMNAPSAIKDPETVEERAERILELLEATPETDHARLFDLIDQFMRLKGWRRDK